MAERVGIHGSVQNRKYQRGPNVASQPNEIWCLGEETVNCDHLVYNLEIVTGINKSTYKIFKKLNFLGYKIQLLQELKEDDPDSKICGGGNAEPVK